VNQKYDCPNCGGALLFQSSVAVFAVCPYCRSMVVRHDVNVEAIGQMAALPPDLSPLQIGTKGEFAGRPFTLIGRVRLAYADGSWTEWCASFSDGKIGWLGETQGFFTIGFEIELPQGFPTREGGLKLRSPAGIENHAYIVTDRKQTTCLWGEGELPFVAKPGREATNIDLTGSENRFASAEYADGEIRLFVGRYARFNDLNFSNLRPVPGWSEEIIEPIHNQTTALNCPNCGSTVQLRAPGAAMSAACGSCGSLIDTSTPDLRLIRTAIKNQRMTPVIPIGRRGTLSGTNYEVIGFQHVRDSFSGWFEYLLFNPWQGFIWLVSYNGHWTLVNRLYERPKAAGFGNSEHAIFEDERYRLFDKTEVTTDYVAGEFYWKVGVGQRVQVADYVKPPQILSRESYPGLDEETWSQGEYISPEIIQKTFNLEGPLRERSGVYLNQLNPHWEKARQLFWLVPVLIVILAAIQMISSLRAARRNIYEGSFTYQGGTTNATIVTPPFEIKGGNQALNVTFTAPVNNNWIEFDAELVNTNTLVAAATFVQGVEYYSGYDDGPWHEGKQKEEVLVPNIAPGVYYFTLDVSADSSVQTMPFTITVVRDVVVWSNFWIALGVLLLYPLYRWTRAIAFERARWANSDFSPFPTFGGSDDDD
jgi:hypothetical protein